MLMRRLTSLFVLAAAAAALAVPAGASASAVVGISDQQATTFTNPLYAPLHLKIARYIAPYDVLTDPTQKVFLDNWIFAARGANQKILLSFEHSRRSASAAAKAPSVSAYTKQLKALKQAYGSQVEAISPWNEVNACQPPGRSEGQPAKICHSTTGAKLVAQYYMAARKVFSTKKIVGIDILDGVNVNGAVGYVKRFKKYAKPLPKYWGVHNYSDTNRGSTTRTAKLIKTIDSKRAEVWLTETGGQLRLRGKELGEARAAKALKCMFSMPKKFKQIKRLYIFNFGASAPGADFDAGLINLDNSLRPGYTIVQKRQSATCHA